MAHQALHDIIALHDAIWLLGLPPHFTHEELEAYYTSLSNPAHELDMADYLQQLIAARNTLWPHARPRPRVQLPGKVQGASPRSPDPSPPRRQQALAMASDFMDVLAAVPRGHSLRCDIGQLRASIQRCRNSLFLRETVNLCARCIDHMAQHYLEQRARGKKPSWKSAFKELSRLGFNIRNNRPVDYGNYEYTGILQAFALVDHQIMDHLDELRRGWELDLWCERMSEWHVEKLGDVVECHFAALRGELRFLIRDYTELPQMFDFFTCICQLVHRLNGHLVTGWLKYRQEPITLLTQELPCDFVSAWCTGYHTDCNGLLLWALFHDQST